MFSGNARVTHYKAVFLWLFFFFAYNYKCVTYQYARLILFS